MGLEGPAADRVDAFKRELFGATEIVLHTADITRNRNGFERLKDPGFRGHFYDALNALVVSLDFTVVACAIRKDDHLARYSVAALDPYMLSLHVLVERFCFDVGADPGGGLMVAERRNPTLDHQLEIAFLNLRVQGTRYVRAADVERRIAGLNLRPKSANIAGLQLADLVATPIGRHVIGKRNHPDFEIVRPKFRRDARGNHDGHGLIVLPRAVAKEKE